MKDDGDPDRQISEKRRGGGKEDHNQGEREILFEDPRCLARFF